MGLLGPDVALGRGMSEDVASGVVSGLGMWAVLCSVPLVGLWPPTVTVVVDVVVIVVWVTDSEPSGGDVCAGRGLLLFW